MAASPAPKDFQFRRLQKPEEFRAVEEVDRAAGGIPEEPPIPTPVQRAFQDNGGLVVGAFAEIYLAGFAVGFLGWDGEKLYLYSHRTAVRPEYQNHHLGFRLKTHQRDEILRQGLDEIRWTFDPLQSRAAFLYLHRLGAVPDRYLVHYFGRLGGEGGENLETDRVRAVWKLQDPTVVARLEAKEPDRAAEEARFRASTPLLETELDDHGLRVPTSVSEPSGPSATLEIPFDLGLIREHAPGNLRTWRHATRDAFRAAFDLGYTVDDFAVVSPDHERRSVYFLRGPPAPAPK
ncbi:MAG: GNAT family N-acetyltransferase [Thermoplasmata archaeon]|nr:GNAT family N-acetyltransferase [Thermoplasmata archaeon]